jgi:hypothetical protein
MRAMPDPPRAVLERPVQLEIEVTCSACKRVVPFASPALRSTCPGCREPVEVSVLAWTLLFREIDERSFLLPARDDAQFSAEQPTPAGRLVARWRVQPPRCAKCAAELMLVEPGTEDPIECARCSTRMTSFPAPAWLRTELPTAMQLYGAARDSELLEAKPTSGFWLTFQGTPPNVSAKREHAIKAAIGPTPEVAAVASTSTPKAPRRQWEWYAILVFLVAMGVAVHRCGAKIGGESRPKDGTEVEPTQPP